MEKDLQAVQRYVADVTDISGLGMSAERQHAHVKEFRRLLDDANKLSALMGRDEYLSTGPITVVRHDESRLPAPANHN